MNLGLSPNPYDTIIVGCGLAGATLSWQLHWAGKKILVVNSTLNNSASVAAAGVISERSGKRHTKSWRWDSLWPIAQQFYRRVEMESGRGLLSEIEHLRFVDRQLENVSVSEDLTISSSRQYENEAFYTALAKKHRSGHAIKHDSAILDVTAYLDATIAMIRQHHRYLPIPLDYADLTFTDNAVHLATKDLRAQHIVFCEGWHGQNNPWFQELIFESARGEALTLKCRELPPTFIYYGEITVSPIGDGYFYVGATYDRSDLSSGPTEIGKSALLRQFKALFNVEFEICGHVAGVRPVVKGRLPIIKQHPAFGHCWVFNGLASRGCLQAPYFSNLLASNLCKQYPVSDTGAETQLSSDIDDFPTITHTSRLTTAAHKIIKASVSAGDYAIDATAGNGNDTLLLARCTAPEGKVYAFDIQDSAITRTTDRLTQANVENVSLLKLDHGNMLTAIPSALHGKISVAMFNLGYLPGGDLNVTTTSRTSVSAVDIALRLLKAKGVCSILCYRGHHGGEEETQSLRHFLRSLPKHTYLVQQHLAHNTTVDSPVLFIVRKLKRSTQSEFQGNAD